MGIRARCVLAVAGMGLIDVVLPIPILALLVLYVIVRRPPWVPRLMRDVYLQGGDPEGSRG